MHAPGGSAPWITITIDDGGGSGSVTLDIAATNLTGDENIKDLYLNLDTAFDPTNLNFSAPTVLAGTFNSAVMSVSTSANAYKADGDGFFDVKISFPDTDGLNTRFTGGDAVRYTVTMPSLVAASFNFTSVMGGGQGTWTSAAHVGNTTGAGSGGSGWVADNGGGTVNPVPEPSSMALAFFGLVALAAWRWRRKR